jgi:hypothetical protein
MLAGFYPLSFCHSEHFFLIMNLSTSLVPEHVFKDLLDISAHPQTHKLIHNELQTQFGWINP